MIKFNINELIKEHELDTKVLASELFPENKYPMIALTRVINGEALLNTDQLAKLSFLTGLPIEALFSGGEWRDAKSKEANIIALENGEYRAELNRDTWITKLYHKNSIFHEAIILDGTAVPMSEYLSELDNLILKYKKSCQKSELS